MNVWKRNVLAIAALALLLVSASRAFAANGEYLITDYGANGNGTFDNKTVIQNLINNMPATGGTIVIPHGQFRINSPIDITKSFVTIRGLNYGQRSNVDVAIPGIVHHPAGGSKLIVGTGNTVGIRVPNASGRISGVTIKDLAIQGIDGPLYQHGIRVERPNDGLHIENINTINMEKGIYVFDMDAGRISGCWLAEVQSPLHLDFGRQCIVNDNHFGGQSGGISVDISRHDHLNFTGNVIFPDGYTGLWMTQASNNQISGNIISGWFTGLIIIEGNMNSIVGNNIQATTLNGSWPADPRGRDGFWGLIRLLGNDNMLASNIIMSWQPENHTRVHVAQGSRNQIYDNYIAAIGSTRKIVVNGTTTDNTRIVNSAVSGEIDGAQYARVQYSP